MRTLRAKIRHRWLWGLGASPLVVAGLIAVPAATPASASTWGPWTFQNVQTGRCLDSNAPVWQGGVGAGGVPLWQMSGIYNQGDTDMGAVYTKTCNPGNFQRWTFNGEFQHNPDGSTGPEWIGTIVNDQTGQCLDSNAPVWQGGQGAAGSGDPDMGAVYTKSCTPGNPFQQWKTQSYRDNYNAWGFVNQATGQCLDSNAPDQAQNPLDSDMGAVYTKSCQAPPGYDNQFQDWSGTWPA